MTLLLCFVSFASILVLFTSTIALALWMLLASFDAFVRAYLAIRQPEPRLAPKGTWDYNHLKRAGQW